MMVIDEFFFRPTPSWNPPGRLTRLYMMVIDEGQQYGTDREIAAISLLKQQPLVLWTGDAQQAVLRARRQMPKDLDSCCLQRSLRSDRNSYMPSNLAEAMIRLLDDSSSDGLTLLSKTLRRGEHVLGHLWTDQLSPEKKMDLQAVNTVLPGLNSQFQAASAGDQAQLPRLVDPKLLEGSVVNFSRSLVRLAWILQHAATLLPMAGEIQAALNSQTAGVSDQRKFSGRNFRVTDF